MTHRLRLPLRRKLASLRVHVAQPDLPLVETAKARWLLDLKALADRQESDRSIALQCLDAIRETLTHTSKQVEENLASIASLATELGLALAREIVGEAIDRELLDPSTTVLRTLESVTRAPRDAGLSIFLSATDFSAVVSKLQESTEFTGLAEHVEFAVDPSLSQGSVRIESGAGRLRYEPLEVLDLLCEEMRKESRS